jgi:hypothetical protein
VLSAGLAIATTGFVTDAQASTTTDQSGGDQSAQVTVSAAADK